MKKSLVLLVLLLQLFNCTKEDNINSLEHEIKNIDITSPTNNFTKEDIVEYTYPSEEFSENQYTETKISFANISNVIDENNLVTILVNEIDSRLKYDNFTFIYLNILKWDESEGKYIETNSDEMETMINEEIIYLNGGDKYFENINFNLSFKAKELGEYKIQYRLFTTTTIENYSLNIDRAVSHSAILEFYFNINS